MLRQVRRPGLKKEWTPTENAFQRFLNWLDEGVGSDGQKYLEMRHRLVLYFDRKNCLSPDELADDTLSRVAQKLQEKGAITNLSPAHYCYVVARFVFLEYTRRPNQGHASIEDLGSSGDLPQGATSGSGDSGFERKEELLERLEQCLSKLLPGDRELILEYHRGDGRTRIENRRRLAERAGLSANALSIRVCRLRNKVEVCVRAGFAET